MGAIFGKLCQKKLRNYTEKEITEITAAKKIQGFVRLKAQHDNLLRDPTSEYTKLNASLLGQSMFGAHVAATEDFAFSSMENFESNYHRDEIPLTDNLTKRILTGLNENQDPNFSYAFIVNHENLTQNGVLDKLKQAYPGDYSLVADPKSKFPNLAILKFKADEEQNTEVEHLLAQIGVKASMWGVAKCLASVEPALDPKAKKIAELAIAKKLSSYASSITQIKVSPEFEKLQKMAAYYSSYQANAQAIYNMLQAFPECEKKKSPELAQNMQRLHLFLKMLVNLSEHNHERFTGLSDAIIHELSLAIDTHVNLTQQPLISLAQFQEHNQIKLFEVLKLTEAATIQTASYITNSGMAAYNFALKNLAIPICAMANDVNGESAKEISYQYIGPQYFELKSSQNFWGATLKQVVATDLVNTSPQINIVGSSPLYQFDNSNIVHPGADLNQVIKRIVGEQSPNKLTLVVLDITSTDTTQLALNELSVQAIQDGKVVLVCWSSLQKNGMLHSDQAQGGDVGIICGKSMPHQLTQHLSQLDAQMAKDIKQLDRQICASIAQEYTSLAVIKKRHLHNAQILREETSQSELQHPFMIADKTKFPNILLSFPARDSFGFSKTVSSINNLNLNFNRISAGSENEADLSIKLSGQKTLNLITNTEIHGATIKEKQQALIVVGKLLEQLLKFAPLDHKFQAKSIYEMFGILHILAGLQKIVPNQCTQAIAKLEAAERAKLLTLCQACFKLGNYASIKFTLNNSIESFKYVQLVKSLF